jgi:RimJ/RimL family protein N-acetyltransferase
VPLSRLTTGRLSLRPPHPDDARAIYDGYARDPDVARYVIWRPHASIDDTCDFLESFVAAGERDGDHPWIIALADGTLIGAMHLRAQPPRAELGFNIAKPYWNRGYATEAVRAVTDFAFTLPGIERVQAVCHVDNAASARVLHKAGMRREGRLSRYMTFPNLGAEAQDVWMYAVAIGAGGSAQPLSPEGRSRS